MKNKPELAGSRSIQLTIAFPESANDGTGAAQTLAVEPQAKPVKDAETTPHTAREACQPTGKGEGKGGRKRKWYSLMDKVYAPANLARAWERVKRNGGAAGIDGLTVEMFDRKADLRLESLSADLKAKRYRVQPVRRVEILKPDGGKRPLGIPTVTDRIVQQALLQVLTPIFEPLFSSRSHGFRPERGCQSCLETVDRAVLHGYEWVVDADIKGFFDNVDQELLLRAINEEVSDGSVLGLIQSILEAGVVQPDTGELEPTELGTPQGSPLSPLLANIYLNRLDQAMVGKKYGLIRYADDFVIFARSQSEAEQALTDAREVLEGDLKLHLHPEKTRVATVDSGFEFLGFHYFRSAKGTRLKTVRRKSRQKFRDSVRDHTPRIKNQRKPKARHFTLRRLESNRRLRSMIGQLNTYLRSWYSYFRGVWLHPDTAFDWEDGHVRRRLRQALTGRVGNGWWNPLIKNEWFHRLGLISLNRLYREDPVPHRYRFANREV